MKIDIDQLRLPARHYSQANYHEASLVSLLIIYRTLNAVVDLDPEDFFHHPWGMMAERLKADPFIPLDRLLEGRSMGDARMVAEAMISRKDGMPKVYPWNVYWHADQVRVLSDVRRQFENALSMILENAAVGQ